LRQQAGITVGVGRHARGHRIASFVAGVDMGDPHPPRERVKPQQRREQFERGVPRQVSSGDMYQLVRQRSPQGCLGAAFAKLDGQ
jgi:hypothetical protein